MSAPGTEGAAVREPVLGYCYETLDGQRLASYNGDREMYAASTLKLAVLLAAVRRVEVGELGLEDEHPVLAMYASADAEAPDFCFDDDPDELDEGMPAQGEPMMLRQILWRMIAVSSNEATNMAVLIVGYDAIRRALDDAGAVSSRFERLYGDLAGRALGLTISTTPADLVRLMRAVIGGAWSASPELNDLMRSLVRAQEYPVIAEELGGEVSEWGSKSGWITEILHDVAYWVPAGADFADARILAVCTRTLEHGPARDVIHGVTRALRSFDG